MTQDKTERIGIYPGTFDPITKGHLHIIKRASKLVDKLIISVAENPRKNPMFSHQERIDLVKSCLLYTSPSPRDLSTSRMPSSA